MAKILGKRVIDEIRFRSDIADVIGSYFQLQRAGSTFKATCPFHKEKTPSFHVNPQKQIFHCFGCGVGGDVFKFVEMQEAVDFMGAVKILAKRAGVEIKLEEGDDDSSAKDLLYKLHSEVAELYHKTLLESSKTSAVRKYLAGREIDENTMKEFQIGFAPDGWDFIVKWGAEHKYSVDTLELAGLIMKKIEEAKETRYYDRFRNRLMFPITDEQGRVIGFSGRALDPDAKTAKYVNSPETPLFRKGRILYALAKARKNIVEEREAVICEGQIDVIRCHQAGINTAVASQGTAFSEDHARILQRYADSVAIVFDPDTAGQEAAVRTSLIFMEAGMAVKIVSLPEKQDPDLFIKKNGAEAFRKLISAGVSPVTFQIDVISKNENIQSEVGLMRATKAVLQTIAKSPNAVQRDRLVQEASSKLNVKASSMMDELRRHLRSGSAQYATSHHESVPNNSMTVPKEEQALCEHIVHYVDNPGMVPVLRKYLPRKYISNETCRKLLDAVIDASESSRGLQDVIHDYDSKEGELSRFAAAFIMAPSKVGTGDLSREEALKDIILYIWRRELERERAELDAKGIDKLKEKESDRRRQITYDLKSLRKWQTAIPVIEIHLSEQTDF